MRSPHALPLKGHQISLRRDAFLEYKERGHSSRARRHAPRNPSAPLLRRRIPPHMTYDFHIPGPPSLRAATPRPAPHDPPPPPPAPPHKLPLLSEAGRAGRVWGSRCRPTRPSPTHPRARARARPGRHLAAKAAQRGSVRPGPGDAACLGLGDSHRLGLTGGLGPTRTPARPPSGSPPPPRASCSSCDHTEQAVDPSRRSHGPEAASRSGPAPGRRSRPGCLECCIT